VRLQIESFRLMQVSTSALLEIAHLAVVARGRELNVIVIFHFIRLCHDASYWGTRFLRLLTSPFSCLIPSRIIWSSLLFLSRLVQLFTQTAPALESTRLWDTTPTSPDKARILSPLQCIPPCQPLDCPPWFPANLGANLVQNEIDSPP
jgi:hypothetical protein